MHHHPIPGTGPGDAESALDAALLGLLIEAHDGLWSLAELSRSLIASERAVGGGEPPCHEIEDAVARLFAAGLVHRVGQFVFASQAAHAAQRLAG